MIRYRPFRNSDPPLLADVWRSQANQRGLVQPMSAAVFEELVLAKPIFDREGLIVAVDDERALGFVHAGFGPTEDEHGLSTERGVTSMIMVRAAEVESPLVAELLARSESYLRERGAKILYGGGTRQLDPFYLGLYGGSEVSGVLDSDVRTQEIYATHGYQAVAQSLVLHADLTRFRPIVDRRQMQIRRRTSIQMVLDPPVQTWWEACTFGNFERTRFELQSREAGPLVGQATFWNMQPLANSWGVHAAGLIDLEIDESERRQGMATYLLGESFRHLAAQGVTLVEVQIDQRQEAARGLFQKLGFQQVDEAKVYRKD